MHFFAYEACILLCVASPASSPLFRLWNVIFQRGNLMFLSNYAACYKEYVSLAILGKSYFEDGCHHSLSHFCHVLWETGGSTPREQGSTLGTHCKDLWSGLSNVPTLLVPNGSIDDLLSQHSWLFACGQSKSLNYISVIQHHSVMFSLSFPRAANQPLIITQESIWKLFIVFWDVWVTENQTDKDTSSSDADNRFSCPYQRRCRLLEYVRRRMTEKI